MNSKPVGYFTRFLVIDCETSGIAKGQPDPSKNANTGETYQAVSWGMLVVDAQSLEIIDKLYVEVKWDGISVWDPKAEKVHGLSKNYLSQYGMSEEEAVVQIGNLILDHFGDTPVCVAGHNVGTFDLPFLRSTLYRHEVFVRFGNRVIDTNSIGFAVFGSYNSDDLFELVGCDSRDEAHNALADACNSLKVIQSVRNIFDVCIAGAQ